MLRNTILFILLFPVLLQAQTPPYGFIYSNDYPIVDGNDTLDLGWAGGLDYGTFGNIDINRDGVQDILVFDKTGNRVLPMIQTGSVGQTRLVYAPRYIDSFPSFNNWVITRDYNNDGKMDLFCHTSAGIMAYRNVSQGNQLLFQKAVSTFQIYTDYGSGGVNIYVSSQDIPAIDDVDGDGDYDILVFGLLGSSIEYHKNMSRELYGHSDSLVFENQTRCYGRFTEGFTSNAVYLDSCGFGINVTSNLNNRGVYRHAGSTILAQDFNGDGLSDLLLGDISFSNATYLQNGGNQDTAFFTSQDSSWPSYDTPVDIDVFPGFFWLDVNRDNKNDIVAAPNYPNASRNYDNTVLYSNSGTNANPNLTLENSHFMFDQMLDYGEIAHPAFFDYNGDGLLDLVVGNFGKLDGGTGTYDKGLMLLENVGTATNPSFRVITEDFSGLSALPLPESLDPTFGDFNGDGLEDMFIGTFEGKIHYFVNTGTASSAQFQLNQANFENIDVGNDASPFAVDLDRDGLMDLVIGEQLGNINYYRNTGTNTNPSFTLETDSLGGILLTGVFGSIGVSKPYIYDTGTEYQMVVGTNGGGIYLYDQIDNNLTGTFNQLMTQMGPISPGRDLSPVMEDLNGDGYPELIVGNTSGGMYFYKGIDPATIGITENPVLPLEFILYPVPARDQITVAFNQFEEGDYQVVDITGRQVDRGRISGSEVVISTVSLEQGMYWIRVNGKTKRGVKSFVISR
jgi:hypothetical protein